mgnify:CR=1 FL=1
MEVWLLNTEDDLDIVMRFGLDAGLTVPMLYDAKQPYDRYYALDEGGENWAPYPLQVVVDADGTIRSIAHQYDALALDRVIEAALDGE